MKLNAGFRRFRTIEDVSRADVQALLAAARALKRAPPNASPLAGKHLALLCESGAGASAGVLSTAAAALGARITDIKTREPLVEPRDLQAMAHMMGRLYDAIACDGIDESTLRALERDAGVPVFNGVARATHPTRLLADVMTMQDATAPARDTLLLCVAGLPADLLAAWNTLATLTDVPLCTRADSPPHDDAAHASGYFSTSDAAHCDDGNLALHFHDGAGNTSLAAQQVANHQLLVQAMLMQAIG